VVAAEIEYLLYGNQMNDRFTSLRLFVRVARTGSFSVAGRELGFSQPTASRIVAALEKKVGVALLTRSTRAVTLTEASADYLARAEVILGALDGSCRARDRRTAGHPAHRDIVGFRQPRDLSAAVEVHGTSSWATRRVPAQRQEAGSDQRRGRCRDARRFAVRFQRGRAQDRRRLSGAGGVSVLSQASWRTEGADRSSEPYLHRRSRIARGSWAFEKDGKKTSIRVEGKFILNGTDSATKAAVAGLGIVSSTHLSCLEEFQNGSLVRVLPDWEMGEAVINVVLPAGRAAKPSARVLGFHGRRVQ